MADENQQQPSKKRERLCAKQADFLLMLARNHFNISETCKELGMSRRLYKRWMKNSKLFRSKMEEIEDSFIDSAEEALRDLVKEDRNFYAVKYLLDNLGKKRGWGKNAEQKKEQDHPVMLFHCENLLLGRDANGNVMKDRVERIADDDILDVEMIPKMSEEPAPELKRRGRPPRNGK